MNFFKKSIYFFIFLASYCIHAQTVKVIDNKGTLKEVDNSKWSTSGSNISNKNSGNVGIGTASPANTLEIKQGTAGNSGLRFTNLTSSSTATTSSSKVLGVNNNGDVILTNVPGTQNIVDFSTATPTTSGVVFTPNTPADESVIYQSVTNNSLWTYNGSTYVTYSPPATTAWNLAGTSNDAGGNKTAAIERTGSASVTNGFLRASGNSNSFTMDPTQGGGPRLMLGTTVAPNSYFELGAYNSSNNFDTKTRDFNIFSTARANALFLESDNGNIGIGTNTPLTNLHVHNPLAATQTINADATLLRLSRPTGARWGNVAQFNLGSYTTGGAAHSRLDIALNNGGDLTTLTTAMTLQGDGNVGIGTTAPLHRLDVNGGSILVRRGNNAGQFVSNQILFGFSGNNTFQHAIKTRHDNGTSGNAIDFYTWSSALNLTNTTEAGKQHVMSLDGLGRVGIGGITGPQSVIDAASISVATNTVNASIKMLRLSIPTASGTKTGNVAEFNMGSYATGGSASTRLDLALNNDSDNAVSQVMTWQANGNVGIGTAAPLTKLVVNDNAYIANLPTTTANLQDNSTFRPLTRFQTSSGINNNAISHYLTTTTAATQAHNYSTGVVLPYSLQPAGGNVGIGTIIPGTTLEVANINTSAFQSTINVTSNPVALSTAGFSVTNPDISKASSGIQFLGWNGKKEGGIFRQTGSVDKSHLLFTVNTTNDVAMSINESRNVGIGTTSPASKLEVSTGVTTTNSIVNAAGSIDDFLQYNIKNTSTGTKAQSGFNAMADNGNDTTGFVWMGINNSNFNFPTTYNIGGANDVAFIGSGQDMYVANENKKKSIIFSTGKSTTPFFGEQMRILNNGNVGIGSATPLNKLAVKGLNNPVSALGTAQTNAIFRVEGETNHALDMGTFSISPWGSYIQSHNKASTGTLPLSINPVGGNVGIGTSNPRSTLEVNGSATNTAANNNGAANAIAFSLSNLAYTSLSAQLFNLTGMKDGGTYTLAVQGTTSGISSFMGANPSGTSFVFKSINNGTTIAGKDTLYTFVVMGTTVYVYMATGF